MSHICTFSGWLTCGDLALDSCAQFLAVAEHRLIPSWAGSVCHQLRSLACQDQVAGGHAGVGVVSLGGAPLILPSFVTPQFKEFFRLGRVLRTTLPTGKGGVVHLFFVHGYQGEEEDADQLLLTDKLLQSVLAEAQVVCIGQPLFIAGDLNADPAVIPCLAKGISAGRFVDLALAYSRGVGVEPDATCKFNREDGTGSRRDFFVGCPNALAASDACFVTDRWFTPHFSVIACFRIDAWLADIACPEVCQPVWPACWLDTPDRYSSSAARVVQDVWDVYREELGWFQLRLYLLLGMRSPGLLWMIFGPLGVVTLRRVYFGLIPRLVVPLKLAALPFLVEDCYVFVAGVWEVELLAAVALADFSGLATVMKLMSIVLSTLSTPPLLLQYSSFVRV